MKSLVNVEVGAALVLCQVDEPVKDKLNHTYDNAARHHPDTGSLNEGVDGEAIQPHSFGPHVASSNGA